MKKKLLISSLMALGLVASVSHTNARADDESPSGIDSPEVGIPLTSAKVSQADAEKAALALVPGGVVTFATLEDENGTIVWEVTVATKTPPAVTEVIVNATTGVAVLTPPEGIDTTGGFGPSDPDVAGGPELPDASGD